MRLTYANVVATTALVVAVSATAAPPAVSWAASKLSPNSVTSATIKDRSIKAVDIAKGAIGGKEIKDGSLGGADIANRSLGGIDIAPLSIGGGQIAMNSVSGDRLVPNSVGSYQIADRSITSSDISNFTISNDKISNDTLGFEKFSLGARESMSRYWAGGKISSGSRVSGYGGVAYMTAVMPEGRQDRRSVSLPFPAEIGGIKEQPETSGPNCSGSYTKPSAAPGYICWYQSGDTEAANNVGTAAYLSHTDRGLLLIYTPGGAARVNLTDPASATVAGEWTFAEFAWAYTAP